MSSVSLNSSRSRLPEHKKSVDKKKSHKSLKGKQPRPNQTIAKAPGVISAAENGDASAGSCRADKQEKKRTNSGDKDEKKARQKAKKAAKKAKTKKKESTANAQIGLLSI